MREKRRKDRRIGSQRASTAIAETYHETGEAYASTELHEERLDTVSRILINSRVRTILDLGCGSGALLERLIGEERFTSIVGIDASIEAVRMAERRLEEVAVSAAGGVRLIHGSFSTPAAALSGFDAAAMVETLEHVPPNRLSNVERVVFAEWRPSMVVITTPNREYNVRFGLAADEYRHPDHCFEWCRARFRRWATGVASRNGYALECQGIGPRDPLLGSPSQLAVFRTVGESSSN